MMEQIYLNIIKNYRYFSKNYSIGMLNNRTFAAKFL